MSKEANGLARMRLSPSPEDGSVKITITDAVSRVQVFEMKLTAEQLVSALAGRETPYDGIPCSWGAVDKIGWRKTNITIPVHRTGNKTANTSRLRSACLMLESLFGGEWSPRDGDISNYHRRNSDGSSSVVFFGMFAPDEDFDEEAIKAEAAKLTAFGKPQ